MKDKIINWLKLGLLIFTMVSGFYFIFAGIWYTVGLPLTDWALFLMAVLAGLAEWAYIKWVSVEQED